MKDIRELKIASVREWLNEKDFHFISLGTNQGADNETMDYFDIESNYKVNKDLVVEQLKHLLDKGGNNTKEEDKEIKAIIERVKNGIK